MSALKPVFPESGIENSIRKSLDAPLKPSGEILLAQICISFSRYRLTISDSPISNSAAITVARLVREDYDFVIVIDESISQSHWGSRS